MAVVGGVQGQFKGEGRFSGFAQGWIDIYSFTFGTTLQNFAAAAKTNPRKFFTVLKAWGQGTPQFAVAKMRSERFLSTTFQVVGATPANAGRVLDTVTLAQGMLVDVRPYVGPLPAGKAVQEFTFRFA
jgi:hypothetical protein